jgi:hypothetical protein
MTLSKEIFKPLSVILPHPLSAISHGPSTYHFDDDQSKAPYSNSHIDDGKGTRGHGMSACDAALHLLKYLADYSQKPNDLVNAALASFNDGDLWVALDLYDEAADMGSQVAQDNAVYLYETLIIEECTDDDIRDIAMRDPDNNDSSSEDSKEQLITSESRYYSRIFQSIYRSLSFSWLVQGLSYDMKKENRIKIRSKFKPRKISSLSDLGILKLYSILTFCKNSFL